MHAHIMHESQLSFSLTSSESELNQQQIICKHFYCKRSIISSVLIKDQVDIMAIQKYKENMCYIC